MDCYRLLVVVVGSLCIAGLSSAASAQTRPKQVLIECKLIEADVNPFDIGSNFEVGTGAALSNKAKSKAKSQALGSVLGGSSGFSLGSSGGSSGSSLFGSPKPANKGPKTGKDPTRGEFTNASSGGVDYGLRVNLGPGNKLNVSLKLKNAPGDGTFHSQWLRDFEGKYHLPVKFIIITLYQEWSLTVWWTYDRYVDGEHVEHQEGGWSDSGRNNLASIRLNFKGKKGQKNAIWNRLGFETATKGVSHLVTEYDLPDKVVNSPCPVRLTNHISVPDKDPVTTIPLLGDIPMLGTLFKNESERDAKRNLLVLIKPHILDTPED